MINSQYLQQDKHLGDPLYINNKDAYLLYNADLADFIYPSGSVSFGADYQQGLGGSDLLSLSGDAPIPKLQLQFFVGGADEDEAQRNVSGLVAACRECTIKRGPSRFEYPAILLDYTNISSGVPPYRSVTLNFAAVCRLPLVSVPLTSTGNVYNQGNTPSGVRFEITPSKKLTSFTIAGITCKDLAANETFVIDGIAGKVFSNEDNRFADTDLTEFPDIQPGNNPITMSTPANVTVSFYPLFL